MAWPQFRRFTTVTQLQQRAAQLYKDQPSLQEKWVNAIIYLRDKSKCGWAGDEKIPQPITRKEVRPGIMLLSQNK